MVAAIGTGLVAELVGLLQLGAANVVLHDSTFPTACAAATLAKPASS